MNRPDPNMVQACCDTLARKARDLIQDSAAKLNEGVETTAVVGQHGVPVAVLVVSGLGVYELLKSVSDAISAMRGGGTAGRYRTEHVAETDAELAAKESNSNRN